MTADRANLSGPLDGFRVVEVASFISGPYAAMLLGDLGAEVIKVERPATGDPFRKWGGHGGKARPQFSAYNRGKRSLGLDFQKPGGQGVIRRLAAEADVLIENFRPGTLDRLGIGYEDLRRVNPRLIYCSISGMGESGPYARRPAYDSIGLALSGLWSRLVRLDRPQPVGPQLGDQLTSLYTVYGVLGAIVHLARTGVGQRVDTNLMLSNMAFLPEPIANYLTLGELGDIDTRARRSQAYAFLGSDDRPFTIHLSSVPKFLESLVRAVDRPELLDDPRFASNIDRIKNYDALRTELQDVFGTRPRADWLDRLEQADVPAAPINTIAEAIDDPQAKHLGAVATYGFGERAVQLVRCPVDYSETPAPPRLPPPDVGEHSVEILASLGYSDREVEALRHEDAI